MEDKAESDKVIIKKIKREGPTRPWQEDMGTKGGPVARSEFPKVDHAEELPFLPFIARAISTFGEIYNSFESFGGEKIPQLQRP